MSVLRWSHAKILFNELSITKTDVFFIIFDEFRIKIQRMYIYFIWKRIWCAINIMNLNNEYCFKSVGHNCEFLCFYYIRVPDGCYKGSLANSTLVGSKDPVRFSTATNNHFKIQILSDGEISFSWAVKSNEYILLAYNEPNK